jgi:NADP-dependent 3-hydroxy acid dehydrogenase YdfG
MQTQMRAAVTGAGSGIGAATARLLQSQGWKVAWLDRDLKAVAGEAGDLAVHVDAVRPWSPTADC